MNRVWTIARRELKSLFDHPTAYILLIVFIAVNDFLFFRQIFLVGAATLRPMLDLMPWLLLFFVPAVTMRVLSDESRSGTIEVVLAQPITEWELLTGKYLGAVLFLWSAFALTLAIPAGLALGADLQMGVIIAQYIGAALLAAAMAAVGIWTSALTRNQITAFILGVGVMFVLVLVGLDPLIVGLPPTLGAIAARLGLLTHFENIGRGVIDLRDVIYFGSLIAIFLFLGYGALMRRKLAPGGATVRRLRLGVTTLVLAGIVVNLLGAYIGGHIDLTPGNAYTLSRATRQIVSEVDDIVTLKLFVTKELPPEVSLLKRDVNDVLQDIRSAGKGKVRIIERDPASDEAIRDEAQAIGIPAIQFNVIGQSQLQIKEGYLGLAIQYANASETIPVIQQSQDLEYRIASAIRSMTRTTKPVVGMVSNPEDYQARRTYDHMREQLSKAYAVRPVTLSDSTQPASDVTVLVLGNLSDSIPADQADRLRAFFGRGGSALIMASGMGIDQQQNMFAFPRPVAWNSVLEEYGVSIRSDMIYDLMSSETVPIPTQFGRVLMPYPFWVRSPSTKASAVNAEISGLFLPWTSTIDTTGAFAGTITPLFLSSRAGGVSSGPTYISPQRQFPRDSLSTRLLGVMVNPTVADTSVPRGRLILIGNADFAADRHVQAVPENLLFALNAIDWLAQDEALVSIRSKDRRPPSLVMSQGMRDGVKYANVVGIPSLVGIAALIRLLQRRRATQRVYQRSDSAAPPPSGESPESALATSGAGKDA